MIDVTLAVLAGGRGVRMGAPKSGLVIEGRPIFEYLLDRFKWDGPTMLVTGVGNQRPVGWERFDLEVTDAVADQGPLRGVLTALEHARTELVALVTVDMPGVTGEQIDWLVDTLLAQSNLLAVMCARTIDGISRIEPFPSVLRASAKELIARRLTARCSSVHSLGEEQGVMVIAAPTVWPARTWTNLKRPEDVQAYRHE